MGGSILQIVSQQFRSNRERISGFARAQINFDLLSFQQD